MTIMIMTIIIIMMINITADIITEPEQKIRARARDGRAARQGTSTLVTGAGDGTVYCNILYYTVNRYNLISTP